MTVSWRRSADVGRGAGCGGGAGAGVAEAGAAPSLAPHCAQKREPAALLWPQEAQAMLCAAPHCGQNRLPSGICAWQAGHCDIAGIEQF